MLTLAIGSAACAGERFAAPTFPPWDIEQYKTGYVAVTRADDHRTGILIFCTLIGTKHIVYAYDGRGQTLGRHPDLERAGACDADHRRPRRIQCRRAAARFANDGYIIRMQLPLPADFEPPQSGEMTLSSGPEALPENRWSVGVGIKGLDDSLRIAFQNCV